MVSYRALMNSSVSSREGLGSLLGSFGNQSYITTNDQSIG